MFGDFKVVLGLQVHPGLWRHAEQAAKAHGGVGGDGAISGADFVDAALGDADGFCDLVAGQPHRFDEVVQQDFAGVDGREGFASDDVAPFRGVQFCALNSHFPLLVVIDDLHVGGVAVVPLETYPPLIIDADAPLPGAVAAELFQPVAGRYAQFVNSAHGVDELEFASCRRLNVVRKSANEQPGKYRRRGFVSEGFDHVGMLLPSGSIVKRHCFFSVKIIILKKKGDCDRISAIGIALITVS